MSEENIDQIRKQIELLALQAHEIQKRKELSLTIYRAKLSFKPNIGQVYYLYEKNDATYTLSIVSPKEWGKTGPYKRFVTGVKLLADHTWKFNTVCRTAKKRDRDFVSPFLLLLGARY